MRNRRYRLRQTKVQYSSLWRARAIVLIFSCRTSRVGCPSQKGVVLAGVHAEFCTREMTLTSSLPL